MARGDARARGQRNLGTPVRFPRSLTFLQQLLDLRSPLQLRINVPVIRQEFSFLFVFSGFLSTDAREKKIKIAQIQLELRKNVKRMRGVPVQNLWDDADALLSRSLLRVMNSWVVNLLNF